MVRQAAGEFTLPAQQSLKSTGAAIEARIYAEDPSKDFRPSTGLLTSVNFADGVRIDGWIETGVEATPYYDPLLAKVIAYGDTREAAVLKSLGGFGGKRNLGHREQSRLSRGVARS